MQATATGTSESLEMDAALLKKCEKSIQYWAGRFPAEREDLVQIGYEAVIRALRSWRSSTEHTAALTTYLEKSVRWAMTQHATDECKRRGIEVGGVEDEALAPDAPDMALEVKEHLAGLDDDSVLVLLSHFAGEDVRSIAERQGMSKSSVHRILTKALETARESA